MTGHELPVAADLGGSQQGFSVQVGEDTEESCAHLQDLRTDHLVGFGRALFVAARLVVDPIRPACGKKTATTKENMLYYSPLNALILEASVF